MNMLFKYELLFYVGKYVIINQTCDSKKYETACYLSGPQYIGAVSYTHLDVYKRQFVLH